MTEETLSARAVALALERYKGRPEVAAEVERRISEPLALARIQAARDGLTAATMGGAMKSRAVREAEALARLVDAAAGVAPRAPAVTPRAPAPSASASPAARSEAVATPAAPEAPDSASAPAAGLSEAVPERNARRLREFEELGGEVRVSGCVATLVGRQGALQELADRERAAGRPRSDRSDIGKALRAEALRRHAHQSG